MSTTLRRYLSNEWQDSADLSNRIYRDHGIPIKPERLVRVLSEAFPDVEADGILVRLRPSEGNAADSQQQRHLTRRQRRAGQNG